MHMILVAAVGPPALVAAVDPPSLLVPIMYINPSRRNIAYPFPYSSVANSLRHAPVPNILLWT